MTGVLFGTAAAAYGLAVDGDGHALALHQLAQMEVQFAHPGAEAFGQDAGIETAQDLAEGIVRGGAVAEVAKRFQIFPLMIGKHGHFRIGIHVTDHGQRAYQEDILESIVDCVAFTKVLDLCQQFQKCLIHSRASCRGFGAFSVFLCILPQGGFLGMNLLFCVAALFFS